MYVECCSGKHSWIEPKLVQYFRVPDEQVAAQVAAERTNLERDLLAHEEGPSSFQEK